MNKAVDVRINAIEIQHVCVCWCLDRLGVQALLILLIMEVFFTGTFYKRKPLSRVTSPQYFSVNFLGTL
jgi:hypothetical protein